MHPLLQLSLACSIIAGCSTQNRLSIPDPRYCYYKGKWYEHGSVFQDKCNTCWCYYGSVGCTDINCGEKPGVCPWPGGGTCIQACYSDRDCPGVKKCCYNGCGYTCQQPQFWP
ncbi:waprin-Phi1-like [Dreissena polymorpha]|uniref:waprin-Phi1-like n=1 Tax=Dreissena polymorpha TaxID=45954 RepID=UPI002264391B|nr:waprin-Phi1-like [Dreissena polymorpha]